MQNQTIPYQPLPPDPQYPFRSDTIAADLQGQLMATSREVRPVDARWFLTPVQLLSPSKARRMVNANLGRALVLMVSPIVFTADSSQALVYYEIHCSGFCGGGAAFWFVHDPAGEWTLRRRLGQWNS